MKILLNSLFQSYLFFRHWCLILASQTNVKNVTCAYSGACENGLCKCQIGYEGDHCETIVRDKFKGVYSVTGEWHNFWIFTICHEY